MPEVYERAYRLYLATYKICQMLQPWGFSVETSCYQSYCYRLVPRVKFIVIKRKVILSNVKQKCGPLSPGSAVNLNKLNLIEIELFIKTSYEVWSSLQPDHETNKYPRRMQVTLQPGTMTGRRSETFEEVISFLFRG